MGGEYLVEDGSRFGMQVDAALARAGTLPMEGRYLQSLY